MPLFDMEDGASADQGRVLDLLTGQVEMNGRADISAFVRGAAEALGMEAFSVMQQVFWLAYDLEVAFRDECGPISSNRAKRRLVESRDASVWVVLNRPVDEVVFRRVREAFGEAAVGGESGTGDDQAEFARRLDRMVQGWKRILDTCRVPARQAGFPGGSDIGRGLNLIRAISAKRDAFSLLSAFDANRHAIVRLGEKVAALSGFYAGDAGRWGELVAFADASMDTIAGWDGDPSIRSAYGQFTRILSLPQPYDRVDEAWALFRFLQPYHDRMVCRRTNRARAKAVSAVEALIERMRAHLEASGADADLRNRALYALREKIRGMDNCRSIERIDAYRRDAEEAFDVFRDEVGGG
jgi:hypothetical protein